MTAVADTGFVVAVTNKTDRWHSACWAVYTEQTSIHLPVSTLTEIAYLLARERGNTYVASFLSNLPKTKFLLTMLEEEDLQRTAALLQQYADSRVDFVDATIVAIAERLNIRNVLTLDRRDFHIVRPRHCDYFDLLPEMK